MVAPIQDLPPTGGYRPINFKRVPLKPILSTGLLVGGYVSVSLAAYYMYYLTDKKITREDVEMRSCRHALMPLLMAERDRAYMKQLRKNRDEEAKLMANVPGWVVGTWFGEPIYKTVPKNTWIDPDMLEFYVHSDPEHYKYRAELHFNF